jgi:hypothetical protein
MSADAIIKGTNDISVIVPQGGSDSVVSQIVFYAVCVTIVVACAYLCMFFIKKIARLFRREREKQV